MSTLSVILPLCSGSTSAQSCIDSLVNQTYKDLEIILVNCGSPLCDTLAAADSRIKVTCASDGGAAAYNAGLDAATGEYIVFADAGSIFDADSISRCMAEIAAHSPDLLVCALETADENRKKVFIDSNMYTRYEYSENIAGYISSGIGFSTVANKIFSAHIIGSRSLRFDESRPLVADGLFNCRYFTIAGHIRCISHLLCSCSGTDSMQGTTEYLAQCKEYSQKLIDAVQSKGLYNVSSRAVVENYQKLLYRHLLLVCAPGGSCTTAQRTAALEALSASADNVPLTLYLGSLPGIKNKTVAQFYKMRQWKLLINLLAK